MSKKDLFFLTLWSVLILILPGFSWILPGRALFNYGDLYLYHYPLRFLATSTLQAGRFPFWNPYIFGGLPLAANSQAVLFYPLSVLDRIFPLLFSFSLGNLFHLWWAGLGLALLSRHQGLKAPEAWLLGFSYGLSPFLACRIAEGVPTLLAALSWVPWAWLAFISGKKSLLAAVWALQFFSGHPQFMMINALSMFLAACFFPRLDQNLKTLALAGMAAAMLAAIQIIPTAEFLARSIRLHWAMLYSLGYSLNLKEFSHWFWPISKATPGTPISVFLETSTLFTGWAILFLAAAGIFKNRNAIPKGVPARFCEECRPDRKTFPKGVPARFCEECRRFPILLIGLGLFFALGRHNPAYGWLLSHTALSFLRTPSRFAFLCIWGLLLMAGAALKSRKKAWGIFAWSFFIFSIFQLFFLDKNFVKTQDALPYLRPNPTFAKALAGAPSRVLIHPEISNPDKAMMYHAMNVNGYEAFYLKDYPDFAFKSEGRAAADASRGYLQKWDTQQMRELGVGWFFSKGGRLVKINGTSPLAYFMDAKGKKLDPAPKLKIKNAEDWNISGYWPPQASRLAISQPFYPGWTAYLSGEKVSLNALDGFLASLPRPPIAPDASFDLNLIFYPVYWTLLVILSSAAWAFWFLRLLRLPS